MKMKLKHLKALTILIVAISLMTSSCEDNGLNNQFGIFTVAEDGITVEMDGTINSQSLNNFNDLLATYGRASIINIKNCDGSSDDEVNLQLSKVVYQQNMSIHLMDNGLIASGGTDFFLAGRSRTKGSNTQIGVHSWSDGTNEATDFPIGHANHLPYIEYYVSVGFTQQEAEDFYYFTINAAPAADIHWMTDQEIDQYNILKP
jgi:type 1 fimbria pilin